MGQEPHTQNYMIFRPESAIIYPYTGV